VKTALVSEARSIDETPEFGSMTTQPVALIAPVRPVALDERPEAHRVVGNAQVAELVHDHVVEHVGGREHQPPVE
jgi:hypothetical protein